MEGNRCICFSLNFFCGDEPANLTKLRGDEAFEQFRKLYTQELQG